jgi:hypothetical protein
MELFRCAEKDFMKKVYIIDVNKELGSRYWYMDRVYITKVNAIKRGEEFKRKFPKGGYTITEWRLHE